MEYSAEQLIKMLQKKLILNLRENEVVCPTCKGLNFVLTQEEKSAYIEKCKTCYTGKLYACPFCGKQSKTGYCDCEGVQKQRESEYQKKKLELFEKAEKISYEDYDGYLALDSDEELSKKDYLEDWINNMLFEEMEVPEFLWAYKPVQIIDIDLTDIILRQIEDDGYEGMTDNLHLGSPLLEQAQGLIKKWQEEQGDFLNAYHEDRSSAVVIKDLVDKVREERSGE